MNTGRIIQETRLRAGFTQKTLADALHVTDKAVSKWERGLSLPDVALLPKIALLLDVDLDVLMSEGLREQFWAGLIDMRARSDSSSRSVKLSRTGGAAVPGAFQRVDFSQIIYDKPLVYYLLVHFLLVGVRKIYVLADERNSEYLRGEEFKALGFDFRFGFPPYVSEETGMEGFDGKQSAAPEAAHPGIDENYMILNEPWFLFGSDLTQQFQGAMLSGRDTRLTPHSGSPVFLFSHGAEAYFKDGESFLKSTANRTLGRGMVCVKMDTPDGVLDAATFVRIYQNHTGLRIGNLEEIARDYDAARKKCRF